MTPLFDFAAATRAQERADRLQGDRFLHAAAVEGLVDRLSAVTRRFDQGLWIAPLPASGGKQTNTLIPDAAPLRHPLEPGRVRCPGTAGSARRA